MLTFSVHLTGGLFGCRRLTPRRASGERNTQLQADDRRLGHWPETAFEEVWARIGNRVRRRSAADSALPTPLGRSHREATSPKLATTVVFKGRAERHFCMSKIGHGPDPTT